jgi:hypothetical protein
MSERDDIIQQIIDLERRMGDRAMTAMIERALSFVAGLMLALVAYGFMVPL